MDQEHQELVGWLKERGHTPQELQKIIEHLKQYDSHMVHASVFDSIDAGQFDLEAVIKEALGTEPDGTVSG